MMGYEMIENGLRETRRLAGLSQGELAARADTTRQTIGALEAGSYAPTLGVALRLARALDCEVGDLFWLEETPTVRAELLDTEGRSQTEPTRVQVWWAQSGRKSLVECNGISLPDCETDKSSRDESRS